MGLHPHRYATQILESHLDTFGHVNNAAYLSLFEDARWTVITERGYGLEYVQKIQQGPVILECQLKFLKELKNRQKVIIETRLDSYEGKIGVLKQEILDEQNQVCCQALFTFGLFDMQSRKLVLPTEAWKKALGMLAM